MKTIPLTQDKVALVDDRFYKRLIQMGPWSAQRIGKTWYARNGKHRRMHQIVLKLANGECPCRIDHKNQNGLDNQLHNLRPATQAQNQGNRGLPNNNRSGFKGVSEHARAKRWVAQIQVNHRNTYLGIFATKQEAARAYNEAAHKHFGEFAWLNRIEQRRKQTMSVTIERRSSVERRAT